MLGDVLYGMAELHDNKIIWFDPKLDNILLRSGPDGSLRGHVADLGEAVRIPPRRETVLLDRARGCVHFMAPEVLQA